MIVTLIVAVPTAATEPAVAANGVVFSPNGTLSGGNNNGTSGVVLNQDGEIIQKPELILDNNVTATADPNKFVLTLDAYATESENSAVKPTDVVMVLDQSVTMRTPAGVSQVADSAILFDHSNHPDVITVDKGQLDTTLGQQMGYYVAQSQNPVDGQYYWYIVKYDPDFYGVGNGSWLLCEVSHVDAIVDAQYINKDEAAAAGVTAQHIRRLDYKSEVLPEGLVFFKSRQAVLYDALVQFVEDLKNTNGSHRVALIGFDGSCPSSENLYFGSDEGMFEDDGVLDEMPDLTEEQRNAWYADAWKDVQTQSHYQGLLSAVKQMGTNRSEVNPSTALQTASRLLAATDDEVAAERERMVVWLTDGMWDGLSHTDENIDEAEDNIQLLNEMLGCAKNIKEQGATVYAVDASTVKASQEKETQEKETQKKATLLHYVSSDYPDAVNWKTLGKPVDGEFQYTQKLSVDGRLSESLKPFASGTDISDVKLDKASVLKVVLSDYVQLDATVGVTYEAFTQPYLKEGNWGVPEKFNATMRPVSANGRVDTVEVSGFDYAQGYVSEQPRVNPEDDKDTAYYGEKLVVKVSIAIRDGFWGGNNVPTNKNTAGLYTSETIHPQTGEMIAGKPVGYFPVPEVNVPIAVTATVEDKTVYYGDANSHQLLTSVVIGGKAVTVKKNGTMAPEQQWMDDFVLATWQRVGEKSTSNLSTTQTGEYEYKVEVTPLYGGTINRGENPGNIVGDVALAKTVNQVGHLYVLIPLFTFKDSVVKFGTSAKNYDFNKNNLASTSVVWKEIKSGKVPGDGIPLVDKNISEPKLKLSYTPDTTGGYSLVDGAFVTDTKVNVSVFMGNQNITDVTTFLWRGCNHDVTDIQPHKGKEKVNEFWVHAPLKIQPDMVVVDYGLDVSIDVLSNDPKFKSIKPVLSGIAKNSDNAKFSKKSVKGTYGKLYIDAMDNTKLRYILNSENGMQMNKEEVFRYQVAYTINNRVVTLDTTVTIAPATSIYFEDTFVDYSAWNVSNNKLNTADANQWKPIGSSVSATQAQDRPGKNNPPAVDANNIYGNDKAYHNLATYSMGSAMKFTANKKVYGKAQFTFCGTGFDITSLVANTTGTVTVDVYEAEKFERDGASAQSKKYVVDTYYGYRYVNGQWVVDKTASGSMYQVPVIKVNGLAYNRYTVVVTVRYLSDRDYRNEDGKNQYDFYLDSIRIYDPANDGKGNNVIEGIYVADGEGWPEYFQLKDHIISKNEYEGLSDSTTNGMVFVENQSKVNSSKNYTVKDYNNYSFNDEVYLAPGQAIAFDMAVSGDVAGIFLAMKTAGGGTASVQVLDVASGGSSQLINGTVETTSVLYYDITSLNHRTVVISNLSNSKAILSLVDIKVTYNSEHTDSNGQGYFTVTTESVKKVLATLGVGPSDVPEESSPESSLPESFTPEQNVPVESTPEISRPESSVPAISVPETSRPVISRPQTSRPDVVVPEKPKPPGYVDPDITAPDTNIVDGLLRNVFTPVRFNVFLNGFAVKEGSKVVVTVTTSEDVEYLNINGTRVTQYTDTGFGTRTWKIRVKAAEIGQMYIAVLCYNNQDLASNLIAKVVEVSEGDTVLSELLTYFIGALLAWFWRDVMEG
jgi:hypothetical protein